jgi:hypothetical protein
VDMINDDQVFLLGGHDIGISSFGASCSSTSSCSRATAFAILSTWIAVK